SKDVECTSIDELQSSLLVHEQKLNRANEVEEQTAFKTYTHAESSSNRGRGREGGGRGRGNRDGSNPSHSSKRDNDSLGKGRGQYDTSKIECYRCGNLGHYKSEKTWVYFLQEKSKAFHAFKSFKALVANEIEKNIRTLGTNR
ncbi:unnamed protein product, partial [Prunus brigantina]